MTARKMLLGLGSPFAQARVDFNRLHGTDSSSGTHPFTSPTNLNDGDDTTHADRAADPHATAYIVQSTTVDNVGAGSTPTSLGSAVTAGNLLVAVVAKSGSGNLSLATGNVFVHGGVTQDRGFTIWDQVHNATDPPPYDPLASAYRVATGDEQFLDWYSGSQIVLFEIAYGGTPSGFEHNSVDQHAAGSAKAIAAFALASAVQIMGIAWGNSSTTITLDQVLGSGYTQDYQDAASAGHNGHPGLVVGHGTSGATPQVTSGQSAAWSGVAVGVTTSKPDETSICQADLGQAYPVNRITLLEAAATGTPYAISYSTDGSSWTTISPTFSAVGALQTYELAATNSARYWRIADNHSPAVALAALTWDTWTIQGFPL